MSAKGIPRKERKALTRIALREAARGCFAELGYEATAIGDIVRKAGVASGTFYVHFSGKEQLLDEMLVEFNATLARRLEALVMDAAAGAASVESVIRIAAEHMLDHWHEHRAFVQSYVQRSATNLSLASLRDGVNPPMAALLRHAIERASGARRDIHADLVTHAILGMWLRVAMQYLFNEKVSRKSAIDTLVHMTVGAMSEVLGAAKSK